jgi:hypothetical protein
VEDREREKWRREEGAGSNSSSSSSWPITSSPPSNLPEKKREVGWLVSFKITKKEPNFQKSGGGGYTISFALDKSRPLLE